MKLLALDTSSLACSVALSLGNDLLERHEEQAREHTRLLVPMVRELIDEAEIEMSDLDAIILGNGPGSFIGMRIAASVAQGLAHGAGLGIVPVSSLAAVAAEVFAQGDEEFVAVTQDAHMSEVYLGLFERSADNLPVARSPERIHDQSAIAELDDLQPGSCVAAGAGWQRYPTLAENNRPNLSKMSGNLYPRAAHLLSIGAKMFRDSGTIAPAELTPAYLRQKVAEKPGQTP